MQSDFELPAPLAEAHTTIAYYDGNNFSFSENAKVHLSKFFTPRTFSNSEREKSWNQSRTALSMAFDSSSAKGLNHTRAIASLAHTKDCAVAVVSEYGKIKGIGIDLESCDRKIEDAILLRITNKKERSLGFAPLQIWTMKEAALKANSVAARTVISDYVVMQQNQIQWNGKMFSAFSFQDTKFFFSVAWD